MNQQESDMRNRVKNYRKLVLIYEALDAQIDTLIMASNGHKDQMSQEDQDRYQELWFKRAEVLNEMRVMEQELFIDDESNDSF